MLIIPILENEPHFDQVTNLDGTDYALQFRYNQREQCYTLTIGSPEGETYHSGAKLIPLWALFRDSVDTRMPPGRLIVLVNGEDRSTPKLGELGKGKRCELCYFTAEDLAAIGAG